MTTTDESDAQQDQMLNDAAYDGPAVNVKYAYELAQAIAHDPDELDRLQADCKLDYSKVWIKIDSRQCDLFRAADMLRLRIMAGRHAEADCIARDMTDALAEEIAAILPLAGRAALTPHDEAAVTRATRALTLGGLL